MLQPPSLLNPLPCPQSGPGQDNSELPGMSECIFLGSASRSYPKVLGLEIFIKNDCLSHLNYLSFDLLNSCYYHLFTKPRLFLQFPRVMTLNAIREIVCFCQRSKSSKI